MNPLFLQGFIENIKTINDMNKRLLILMASLLLCGAVSAQTHFEVNTHAQDNNMPVVAQVVLDGDAVTTGGYELGAFIGDEVRGSAQIQPSLDNTYWIQVYYSTDDEATATVSFKLYDGDEEYTSETTLTIDPEGAGTPGEPVEIVVNRAVTQTTAMVNGWNWWGTYVELENNNGLQQLEEELGASCVKIKSRTDGNLEPRVIGGNIYWLGSLNAIHNEQMYMIQTNTACDVSIAGQRASSSSHPITINYGWNWIGYPCDQNISLTNALSGFTPSNGDKIKSRSGSSEYYSSANRWLGSLNTLEPGMGYMYKSNSSEVKTLIYQSGRQALVDNNGIKDCFYQSNIDRFAYNMTITAVIELDGSELRSDDFEVAAFVGNECRGSAKLMYVEEFPGVQLISMKLAFRMCQFYPELMDELKRTVEAMEIDYYKPAVRSVRSRILNGKLK